MVAGRERADLAQDQERRREDLAAREGDLAATRAESERLERAIDAIAYVASECRTELETHCADVEVGEGRVAQCLVDHASELSPGCDQALTDVGVK